MGERAKVAFIGAGNLAWHLAPALHRVAADVVGIWGRSQTKHQWPLPYSTDLSTIPQHIDVLFLAVPDSSIGEVASQLAKYLPAEVHIIHGSGATGIDALDSYFRRSSHSPNDEILARDLEDRDAGSGNSPNDEILAQDLEDRDAGSGNSPNDEIRARDLKDRVSGLGAFWPIRSLTIGQKLVDFSHSAIGYYSPDPELEAMLKSWAEQLGPLHFRLDDHQRASLHLAAAIGQNFTNFIYHLSYQLAEENGLPFRALIPLLQADPMNDKDPIDRQTGPAIRGDQATLEKHLNLLKDKPETRDLYLLVSQMIAAKNER
ncbi:MAG: DUF2520 domain-containing protein [Bacteroidota bacterium]